jgi:hypothetical protein
MLQRTCTHSHDLVDLLAKGASSIWLSCMHKSWVSPLCCVLLSGPLFQEQHATVHVFVVAGMHWMHQIGSKPKPNKLLKSSEAVEAQYMQGHCSLEVLLQVGVYTYVVHNVECPVGA